MELYPLRRGTLHPENTQLPMEYLCPPLPRVHSETSVFIVLAMGFGNTIKILGIFVKKIKIIMVI